MGKNQLRLLKFAIQYQGWSPYGTDRSTVDALNALEGKGLIEVDREKRKFRLDQPEHYRVQPATEAA